MNLRILRFRAPLYFALLAYGHALFGSRVVHTGSVTARNTASKSRPLIAPTKVLRRTYACYRSVSSLKAAEASNFDASLASSLDLNEFDVVEYWAAESSSSTTSSTSSTGSSSSSSSDDAIIKGNNALHLGVVLRDGTIQPLCCWQVN